MNSYPNCETGFLNITPLSTLTKMPEGNKLISMSPRSECGALRLTQQPFTFPVKDTYMAEPKRTGQGSPQSSVFSYMQNILYNLQLAHGPSAFGHWIHRLCNEDLNQDSSGLRHEAVIVLLDTSLQHSAREMPPAIRT